MKLFHRRFFAAAFLFAAATTGASQAPEVSSKSGHDGKTAVVNRWLVEARVEALEWGASELQGRVRYLARETPYWDVEITGGKLSLEPWERDLDAQPVAEQEKDGSALSNAAATSAGVVRELLTAPARLLTGGSDGEAQQAEDERFFSREPLEYGFIKNNNGQFVIKLDSLTSREGEGSGAEAATAPEDKPAAEEPAAAPE